MRAGNRHPGNSPVRPKTRLIEPRETLNPERMNQVTEEIANRVFGMAVNTAKVPMEMRSPYELNISDAVSLLEEGEWHAVAVASLRALKYAVGIHGKPYQDAFRIIYGDPKPCLLYTSPSPRD